MQFLLNQLLHLIYTETINLSRFNPNFEIWSLELPCLEPRRIADPSGTRPGSFPCISGGPPTWTPQTGQEPWKYSTEIIDN